ncbi:MAG: hypothetical protein H0U74_08065 [Bradymonadaceae bacterium]|nr:hypothetical protein [Lujinxingiaceae bacterium]
MNRLLITLLCVLICAALSACTFEPAGQVKAPNNDNNTTSGDVSDANLTNDAQADTTSGTGDDVSHEDGAASDVASTSDVPTDNDTGIDASIDVQAEVDVAPQIEECEGVAVDLNSDAKHCGACSNACDQGFGLCQGGTCACSAGLEVCSVANRCHDTARDANHCGSCGNSCGPGAHCKESQCICRPGLTLCNGVCVDTERNPAHCSGCGTSCGTGRCDAGECKAGSNCGFGKYECSQGGATACLSSFSDLDHSLYCAPRIGAACGAQCEGDEVCRQDGLISALQCRSVRPGRDCTACPCADCGEDRCLDSPDGLDGIYCL